MFPEKTICECDPSLVSCVQVDSGYNTYSTCTTSLMDGVSTDSQSKEPQDTHTAEEGLTHSKHTKSKVTHAHSTEVIASLISLMHRTTRATYFKARNALHCALTVHFIRCVRANVSSADRAVAAHDAIMLI